MVKVAIVVLADTETPGDMGRVANALEAVKEFKEAKDEVQLIFDGAGTKWIPKLSKQDNWLKVLFDSVKDTIAGACGFCSIAFSAREGVQACGIPLLGEYDGHPSFKKLLSRGYQVITF
ncbi:MAG: hypothetical protein QF829_02815 [Candidatus Hydrothermarchaeota archaeon]|nr:hypothetical protein [Candidatus Hydrothermarchaeota archaeon]